MRYFVLVPRDDPPSDLPREKFAGHFLRAEIATADETSCHKAHTICQRAERSNVATVTDLVG
jgi:hypothetical protein